MCSDDIPFKELPRACFADKETDYRVTWTRLGRTFDVTITFARVGGSWLCSDSNDRSTMQAFKGREANYVRKVLRTRRNFNMTLIAERWS